MTNTLNNWINNFVEKRVHELPEPSPSYDFKIMESPDAIRKIIIEKNATKGLSRIVSTFDYEHKKDGGTYFVDDKGLNMPWNTTDSSSTWAERSSTIDEVGSIYTVQGFDLNYVGVIIGPSIDYDTDSHKLVIKPEYYRDRGGFTGRGKMSDEEVESAKERIILNSLNVLLKRGVFGLYIYATNKNLRNKLLELQRKRDSDLL